MCLAVPGKLESVDSAIDPLFKTGTVSFGGVKKSVNLSMVSDAVPGDFLLVHVGVALSKIDEDEAHAVFQQLKEMGELEDLISQNP